MIDLKISKIAIAGLSAVILVACGNAQEKTFNAGCETVFEDESDDFELVQKFCGCMYTAFGEQLTKDEMSKLTTLFAESENERSFMKKGDEVFGNDRFRDFGRIADTCDPDDL